MKYALALLLVACVSVPPTPGAMCAATSDCASGEVCQEGVCWGDPPMGTFAATLAPPSDRVDLVSSEIPLLVIPQNGWLDSLQLASPVMLTGRVEAYCSPSSQSCNTSALGATITFTRKSQFAGGAGFRDVEQAKDGIARGTDSFAASLPATGETDPPFTVTIVPDGRDDTPPSSGMSPAMIAPPMRTTLAVPASTSTTFVLGSATSRTISGTISNGTVALTKYRVAAIAQWDAASPPTEVSTVSYSSDGSFHVTIADAITGPVTLVAKPWGTALAPTLRLNDVQPGTAQVQLLQPANVGNPVDVTIPIEGVTGAGAVAPVSGARVIVTGAYDPTFAYGTHAVLSVETTTGDDGLAHVTLLDGSALRGGYKVRVVPPASSSLGVIFDQPLVYDNTGLVDTIRLPSRVALSGVAVDTTGAPLRNLSITARPSLRFQWSLDPATQLFLTTQIPPSTAVTADSGDFVVWVDPLIASAWGHYDITFEPQNGATVPSWTLPDVEIPRVTSLTTLSLDNVTIPDAAFIHGALADAADGAVVGGELRIYDVITDLSLCSQVAFPPADCVIPAPLVGHGTSDAQGIVRLTLARP